ncbi:uncharacterized protein LOC126891410 [Diabrotica virgifera virgifera]|uniref:TTF-type domain-containing protein n=1 Tax=Diabrotica virgifera virgifera TaxID=50390 RepID=A0ABM5L278_DIAVI|nr:uncharacterized protein LOC126891410 [Diabrotica virgifera virgifera]
MTTIDILNSVTELRQNCNSIIDIANEVLANLNKDNISFEIDDQNSLSDNIVNHDPAMRPSKLSTNQKNYLIRLGPHQPRLAAFPSDAKNRFNAQWYNEFEFLEYSTINDSAFCFVCCLFPKGIGREKGESSWVEGGVKGWGQMKSAGKNKLGKLQQHFSSMAHKAALSDYCNFLITERHIDVFLDKNKRNTLIEQEKIHSQNKRVLWVLMDTIRTLGILGLGFRKSDSASEGNFGQIVNLISRHNSVVKQWFDDRKLRPYHVTYMSGESQNEMISLIGSEVRSLIIEEIKECLFFSIMADTTPDLSHKDILSLVIRYADNKGNIHERLIKTVECCDKSGLGMAELLIKCLSELEIDSSKLAFQSYDFASNMSGGFNGVQKKITDIVEHNVPYIPCQDHRTNTVLEHACNVSALIRNFFDTLEELYVFFTSSTKRFKHLQEKIQEIDKSVQLKNLSRTRWTAKADSVRALNQTVDQIIEVLSDISKNREFDGSTRTKALGLYKKILNFVFIASFFFLKNILPKIKILTETIETPNLNIIDCINLIKTTALNLRNTDYDHNSLNSLIESAIKYAEKLNIDPYSDFSKYHRRRIMPKKIDENRDTEVDMDLKTFFRRDFQEILDTLSSGLNDNFEHIKKSIEPLYSVLTFPLDKRNITLKILGDIVAMFPPGSKKPDVHSLQDELEVLFDMNSKVSSFPELLSNVTKLKDNLNQAFCFCMFVLTVPYGVSTNERSFSQLKIIKNVLRTTMSDERLDNLMLLKCESDMALKLDLGYTIDKWATLKKRRIILK